MNIYAIPKAHLTYAQFLLINSINDIQSYINKGLQIKKLNFNQHNVENLLNLYDNRYYYKIF